MLAQGSQNLSLVVSDHEITDTTLRCAQAIRTHLNNKSGEVIFVCILKGALFFFRDVLALFEDTNYEIDFCKLTSYSANNSTGKIDMQLPCQTDVNQKHVIVFEDIVDTGLSVDFLRSYFHAKNVKSLMICALLDKPEMRKISVQVDFTGITVPKAYLVGYGLDFNQKYRLLKGVYRIEK